METHVARVLGNDACSECHGLARVVVIDVRSTLCEELHHICSCKCGCTNQLRACCCASIIKSSVPLYLLITGFMRYTIDVAFQVIEMRFRNLERGILRGCLLILCRTMSGPLTDWK
jgi:hypothetical protein